MVLNIENFHICSLLLDMGYHKVDSKPCKAHVVILMAVRCWIGTTYVTYSCWHSGISILQFAHTQWWETFALQVVSSARPHATTTLDPRNCWGGQVGSADVGSLNANALCIIYIRHKCVCKRMYDFLPYQFPSRQNFWWHPDPSSSAQEEQIDAGTIYSKYLNLKF